MKQKVWLLLFVLTLTESARHNAENLKKESRASRFSNSKPRAVSSRQRGEVFENLLNVYDPSFLSVVWPRISNGVHLFVEPACWDHLGVFFKDLADGRAWAYRAVDASGRYRSGLLQGNRFWLGSKQQCLALDDSLTSNEISNETVTDEFQNRDYLSAILRRERHFHGGAKEWRSLIRNDELMRRLIAADHRPPYRLRYTAVTLQYNLTKLTMIESYDIILGVCLPRSCRPEDVHAVINFSIMINDHFKSNKSLPRSLKVTSLRPLERYYDITTDISALILIFITVILGAICVLATIVDLKLIKCRTRSGKARSFDLQRVDTYNNLSRVRTLGDERRHYDYLTRKNLVDLESLTKNMKPNNVNMVSVKKVAPMAPAIALDLDVSMDRVTGSCKRCGKYKKQCNSVNQSPRFQDLPACPRVKSIASLNMDHSKQESLCKSVLLCFSLRQSWRKIFNANMANKDLSVIHVLKVVSVFWIIFIHVAMIANYASEDGGDINDHNNAYYILATGTLAFDTLFFVSGVISAHHYQFVRAQYNNSSRGGVGVQLCARILQLKCFIINRAIRLLPPYTYAIFLSGLIGRAAVSTRAVSAPTHDHDACYTYWWRNLLYVTTAFDEKEQCMQISWYMSVETQLHALSAACCALLACGRRVTLSLLAAAMLVVTAADLATSYHEFDMHFPNVYTAYSTVISRPLSRVTPYFLGVLTGWLVHRMEGRVRVARSRSAILWSCSFVCAVGSVCAPCVSASWALAALHAMWPASLVWPGLVLATIYAAPSSRVLSSGLLPCLSRMSYSMLLLHVPIATLLLLHDGALCASTACIWSYFAGTCLLSVLAALVLSLLLETPCCTLYRRLADLAT